MRMVICDVILMKSITQLNKTEKYEQLFHRLHLLHISEVCQTNTGIHLIMGFRGLVLFKITVFGILFV